MTQWGGESPLAPPLQTSDFDFGTFSQATKIFFSQIFFMICCFLYSASEQCFDFAHSFSRFVFELLFLTVCLRCTELFAVNGVFQHFATNLQRAVSFTRLSVLSTTVRPVCDDPSVAPHSKMLTLNDVSLGLS